MPKKKRETLQRTPIDYETNPDRKQDWYSVPRDVGDYMFLVGANTWRILSFTLDATNYTNQTEPKRITLDEFRFGRKKRDRSRLHAGTSASEPTILASIREGIASDTLYVEADGHDQGRIQKRYAVIAPDNPGKGVQLTPEGIPWIKLVNIGVYYLSEWTVQQNRDLLALDEEKRARGDKNAKKEQETVTPIPLCYFDREHAPDEGEEAKPLSNNFRDALKKLKTPLKSFGSGSKEMRDRTEVETQEELLDKNRDSKGGAPTSRPAVLIKNEKEEKRDEGDAPPTPSSEPAPRETAEQARQREKELARRAEATRQYEEAKVRREQEQREKAAKERREIAAGSIAYFAPLAKKAREQWERLKHEEAGPDIIQRAYDEMREYEYGLEQAQRALEG